MPSGLYADTTLRDLLGLEVGDALVASGGGTDLPEYTTDDEGKVLGIVVDESGEEDVAELAWLKSVPQPADATGEGGSVPSVDSGKLPVVNDDGDYELLNLSASIRVVPMAMLADKNKVLTVTDTSGSYGWKAPAISAPSTDDKNKLVKVNSSGNGYEVISAAPTSYKNGLLKLDSSGNGYEFLKPSGTQLMASNGTSWGWKPIPYVLSFFHYVEHGVDEPEYLISVGNYSGLVSAIAGGAGSYTPFLVLYADENGNVMTASYAKYVPDRNAVYVMIVDVDYRTGTETKKIFEINSSDEVTLMAT